MHSSIFRKYDINCNIFQEEIYTLGQAFAYYFTRYSDSVKTVIIGRDNCKNSAFIEQELSRALTDTGLNVIILGACTNPIIHFSLNILPVQASLMITSSSTQLNNSNIIKIYLNKELVWGKEIELISNIFYNQKIYKSFIKGSEKHHSMVERYIDWLAHKFNYLQDFNQKININCSSDIPQNIVSDLFQKIKLNTIKIASETDQDNLQSIDYNVDLNLSLKNSCKKLIVHADNSIIDSDKLIAIYSKDIINKNPNTTIIYDTECSLFLDELITNLKANYKRVNNSTIDITDEMKSLNSPFAADSTGQFYFQDNYFGYSDALYSALRLMDILYKNQKNLEYLLLELPHFYNIPEIKIDCDSKDIADKLIENTYRFFAAKTDITLSKNNGIQAILPYGNAKLKSLNNSIISIKCESKTLEGLEKVKNDFINIFRDHIDSKILTSNINQLNKLN